MDRRLTDSPTVTVLIAFVVVFSLQQIVAALAGRVVARSLFALSMPVTATPWTVVTSVYAHTSPSHLVANAVGLALAGLLLERRTTPARFHAFFVATGAVAGLTQVWLSAALAGVVPGLTAGVSVLGASGAIFALVGYLLASNALTDRVIGTVQVSPRVQLLAFVAVAVAVTLVTASPQAALFAHFTGLLLGFLAGRAHLLRPASARRSPDPV